MNSSYAELSSCVPGSSYVPWSAGPCHASGSVYSSYDGGAQESSGSGAEETDSSGRDVGAGVYAGTATGAACRSGALSVLFLVLLALSGAWSPVVPHALPTDGLPTAAGSTVLPQMFTGTVTGTSTALPEATPGEFAAAPCAPVSARTGVP
ncbi:hypothetical protein IHE56_12195 [Streptomyces sp. ID01-12c]|nr:hypothetical protein [Streptomyces caniscabiei]